MAEASLDKLSLWTNDFLDLARLRTDPLADQVIQDLVAEKGLTESRRIFDILIRNVEIPLDQLPDSTRAYFENNRAMPDWVDWDKIKLAEKVYLDHGPSFLAFLYYKSLPTLYACKNGVQVLLDTGRLAREGSNMEKFTRRIAETGQFLMFVMAPGGMSESGRGVEAILKVRLIHSAIRAFIKAKEWDTNVLGEPINQEDMAITLMTFSVSLIDALPRFNLSLKEEEAEAYLHTWQLVGHFLGLEPDLVPDNMEQGRFILDKILQRQAAESEAGKMMTDALISFAEAVIPRKFFDGSPRAIMRHLIGDEMADMLGIDPKVGCLASLTPFFMKRFFKEVEKFEDQNQALEIVLEKFSLDLMYAMVNYFNKHKGVKFEVPEELQKEWKLGGGAGTDQKGNVIEE